MAENVNLDKLFLYPDWEEIARKSLDENTFDYLQEGAGEEDTLKNNSESFRSHVLIPRVLRGILSVNMSTNVLGMDMPAPFMLAPVGGQRLFDPKGDISSSGAAASMGIPFISSTVSSFSMEDIALAMGNSPRLFQLYMYSDMEINLDLVRRAEDSGYKAIVVTADGPMIGRRIRSLKNGADFSGFTSGNVSRYSEGAGNEAENSPESRMSRLQLKRDISWESVAEIRRHTSLPVVIKGILNPLDAEIAMESGVDGIIVSNHGGRQLDGAISSLSALQDIKKVTGERVPLLLDGGIRNGSDILKALCMGASSVLVGRLYVYALSVGGQRGVERVIRNLMHDLETSMFNCGISRIKDADESLIGKKWVEG